MELLYGIWVKMYFIWFLDEIKRNENILETFLSMQVSFEG